MFVTGFKPEFYFHRILLDCKIGEILAENSPNLPSLYFCFINPLCSVSCRQKTSDPEHKTGTNKQFSGLTGLLLKSYHFLSTQVWSRILGFRREGREGSDAHVKRGSAREKRRKSVTRALFLSRSSLASRARFIPLPPPHPFLRPSK